MVTVDPKVRRRDWLWLAGVAAISLGIRLTYLFTISRHELPSGDQFYYYYWPAVQLARGNGFIGFQSELHGFAVPGAEHPPGFIVLLAGFYKLGLHSPVSMRIALAVLGTGTVVIVGVLVRRLVSSRAGIIAGLIAAIYPNIWMNDVMILSETLFLFGLGVGLAGVYRFRGETRWQPLVAASAGFALAASARPESILLFVVVLVPVVIGRTDQSLRRRLRLIGVAAIAPVLVFGSWGGYNLGRFSKPVPLSTGFGQTMLAATCHVTFSGPTMGSYSVACPNALAGGRVGTPSAPGITMAELKRYGARGEALIAYTMRHGDLPEEHFEAPPAGARVQDQSIDNEVYTRRAMGYIRHHMGQVPSVVLAREARLVGLWNPTQQNQIDYFEQRGSLSWTTTTQRMFWFLGVLAIGGAVIWRRRRIPLYPLVAEIALTGFVVMITFGLTRYRVGLDLCVVILASTSIDAIMTWLSERLGRRPSGRSAVVDPDRKMDPAVRV